MDQTISDLSLKLDKFKSWIKEPRLYIVEKMDVIANEIDIFAERFLMRASKYRTKSNEQIEKDHDQINSNRRQMIEEVEAFQKKLLAKMPTNDLETELAKNLTKVIEELDKKLRKLENEPTSENASDMEYAIDCAIYEFDCAITQKSSLMFINVFLLKKSLNSHTKFNKEANIYAVYYGIKQPVSEIERDEEEVEYEYPNAYAQLDSTTFFGVLLILDDCISKEEFA